MRIVIKLQRMLAGAALAVAVLIGSAADTCGGAMPAGGESFTGAATDLQRIAGFPIEIHATPVIANDASLPLICRMIVDGFRDAAADPEMHTWLPQIVQVVVIDGWSAGKQMGHVELKDKEMTIKTLTGEAEIENLRLLVAETLKKKVAQLKARQATAK